MLTVECVNDDRTVRSWCNSLRPINSIKSNEISQRLLHLLNNQFSPLPPAQCGESTSGFPPLSVAPFSSLLSSYNLLCRSESHLYLLRTYPCKAKRNRSLNFKSAKIYVMQLLIRVCPRIFVRQWRLSLQLAHAACFSRGPMSPLVDPCVSAHRTCISFFLFLFY